MVRLRRVCAHFGAGREQDAQEVHAQSSIDHAVGEFAHDGEPIAGKPLDDPDFPQWPRAIQLVLEDLGREGLELLVSSGPRQPGEQNVLVHGEVAVVEPDRVMLDGRPLESLPTARRQMEECRDATLESLEVDPSAGGLQWPRFEDLDRRHVHVEGGCLGKQKGMRAERRS